MPNSRRFMQSSRGPRGRWPGGLQRGNGQYPQRSLSTTQSFSFLQDQQEDLPQIEDADEEVQVKTEPTEDVGVNGAPSSAQNVAEDPAAHGLAISVASSHHLNQVPVSNRA